VRVLTGCPSSKGLLDQDRFDEYDFRGILVYRFHHAYIPMGGQVSMIEVGYDNRLGADHFDRILNTFKPDLVHFFHLNRLGTGLIARAAQAGVRQFMTPTDFWAICPTGQLLLGDGSLCAGPSAYAGNCLKHLTQSTQKGIIGKAVKWLPTAGADLLVRFTKKNILPTYPKQSEVLAIARRLPANVSRLNQLNGIIVPNGFMKDFLVRHGVMPSLITLASFGIDVSSTEVKERLRRNSAPLQIGFIGTLASHKGCHVLIDAFKKLPASSAILKIYGRMDDFAEYSDELRLRVGKHQSIEFCGTFPNSEIAQVLAEIDVLVVPSIWYENTPLVLYSAQAARCPVVASNLPGLAEVIQHGENGLLFLPGNSTDLAQQLTRLVNEDDLLQRLSAHARPPKYTQNYVDELLKMWRPT
jgi:glycosyltransferase involved in cell wall biosynthesis